MNQMHTILEEIQSTSMECVLATIIHVEGSAYLREGTSMLIKKDGTSLGVISVGCIEEDLILHSCRVFERKNTETFVYHMERDEDLEWGIGTGCNGTIYILLEYVDHKLKENLSYVLASIKEAKVIVHQIELDDEWNLLGSSFRPEDENNNEPKDNDVSFIYMQKFIPKPRLIIFGAGCDVYPVVTMATSIGFLVTVCDWRSELCNENNIPDAVSHIIGFPTEIMEQLSFKKDDYVIIMTHNFQRDKEILSLMMNQSLSYIGVLGSKKRTASLFDMNPPNNIHSPIGLSIGAKGPFEIAVSIIAELIQHKRMKGHSE